MKVNKELLDKIAKNARLELTESEIKEFIPQLQEILKVFSTLESVNTDGIEPSFQPIGVNNVLRDDKVEKSLTTKEVFQGIQNKQDNYFKGPKAI
tara:strand:- start:21283 stop:21567 length:285 start_codon:yes stop_codon:yes gene_type:complete